MHPFPYRYRGVRETEGGLVNVTWAPLGRTYPLPRRFDFLPSPRGCFRDWGPSADPDAARCLALDLLGHATADAAWALQAAQWFALAQVVTWLPCWQFCQGELLAWVKLHFREAGPGLAETPLPERFSWLETKCDRTT